MSQAVTNALGATALFLATGVVVHFFERRWPLRTIDRRAFFALDLFGLFQVTAVTIVFNCIQPHLAFIGTCRLAHAAQSLPWLVQLVSFIVLRDFILYWAHRVMHAPALWRTHAWHHQPRQLYWFAGNKITLLDMIQNALPLVVLFIVFAPDAAQSVVILCSELGAQQFMHANIRLPPKVYRVLEWFVVTPRYHFLHHARNVQYSTKNYASLFTVWDRLFGTFAAPDSANPNEPTGLMEPYESNLVRLVIGV